MSHFNHITKEVCLLLLIIIRDPNKEVLAFETQPFHCCRLFCSGCVTLPGKLLIFPLWSLIQKRKKCVTHSSLEPTHFEKMAHVPLLCVPGGMSPA